MGLGNNAESLSYRGENGMHIESIFAEALVFIMAFGTIAIFLTVCIHAMVTVHRDRQATKRFKEDLDWIEEYFGK